MIPNKDFYFFTDSSFFSLEETFLPSEWRQETQDNTPYLVICREQATSQRGEVLVGIRHGITGPAQQEAPCAALSLLPDLVQVGIQSEIPPLSAAETFHSHLVTYSKSDENAIDPGQSTAHDSYSGHLFSSAITLCLKFK